MLDDLKIVACYDVCRQDRVNAPKSIEPSKVKNKTFDQGTELFGDEYFYMHICTQPLKLVAAKSILCDIMKTHLEAESKKTYGVIEIPTVFIALPGVEKTMNGGTYTLKWDREKK